MEKFNLTDFPLRTYDKVRYGDTDRQGHVNNTAFAAFLESGRVEVLYNPDSPLHASDASFVIVSLQIDFAREITWPGRVDIGTGIEKIGSSSIRFFQRLFQNGECVAQARTVVVQVSDATKKSAPLSDQTRQALGAWILSQE